VDDYRAAWPCGCAIPVGVTTITRADVAAVSFPSGPAPRPFIDAPAAVVP